MADTNRCRNCDLCCNGELCDVCNFRRRCQYCLRRLPSHCFNDDDVDVCKVTIDAKYYNLFFKCNLGLFFKPYICCNYFVVVCATRRYERPFPQTHCVTRCFNSDGFRHERIQLFVRRTIQQPARRYCRRNSVADTS